ncbi:TAT-binding protein-like protein 7, AAA ATPase [Savitreella phatthalungensis]
MDRPRRNGAAVNYAQNEIDADDLLAESLGTRKRKRQSLSPSESRSRRSSATTQHSPAQVSTRAQRSTRAGRSVADFDFAPADDEENHRGDGSDDDEKDHVADARVFGARRNLRRAGSTGSINETRTVPEAIPQASSHTIVKLNLRRRRDFVDSVDDTLDEILSDSSEEEIKIRPTTKRLRAKQGIVDDEDRRPMTKAKVKHRRTKINDDDDDDYDHDQDSDEDEDLSDGSISHSTADDDTNADFVVADEEDDYDEDEDGNRVMRKPKAKLKKSRSTRASRQARRSEHAKDFGDSTDTDEAEDDLEAELYDLQEDEAQGSQTEVGGRSLRDRTHRPNYTIPPPPIIEPRPASPLRREYPYRSSFRPLQPHLSNFSSMNGFGNGRMNFGIGAAINDSSDSDSDNETATKTINGGLRKAPSSGELMPMGGAVDGSGSGTANAAGSGPKNMGRIKGATLADAEPLAIDKAVSFDKVGGLDTHINQLKEMVMLPLLYPEIFARFSMTPPRGVLFHGPPGTGKTLMARALAASCSTQERQVAFYMRKGADCLSKWVGEAERQLRLLFEEAKANQPSIIFFDEIDGLAPVRSSKQEQIHASIVSTMLALMDGMDARGQVVVIGATNRPDAVDPALRRPGRFDREFYFPLPNSEAREKIIAIHTSRWNPPVSPDLRHELAMQTKGYGGADLRALCIEAALNAVQRSYPQIYRSDVKLLIDPNRIQVVPRDFMRAVDKIVPSSARSVSNTASPLPEQIRPLLQPQLNDIKSLIDRLIPVEGRLNALEDALTGVAPTTFTFAQERMLADLSASRTFRPGLIIRAPPRSGLSYIAPAILQHLERFHVQTIDLAKLYGDIASTPEAVLVQTFAEAQRHKPSIVLFPAFDRWLAIASQSVRAILCSLLESLRANDALLCIALSQETDPDGQAEERGLLGENSSSYDLTRPGEDARRTFFSRVLDVLRTRPIDFPDISTERRPLPVLEKAPVVESRVREPSREELKAIEEKDKHTLLVLKSRFGPLMELIRTRYKKFKKPILDEKVIAHLLVEDGVELPDHVGDRNFERTTNDMILDKATGRQYFNMDTSLLEERLWNNVYLTPKQFLRDVEQILHDARQDGDRERILKAQEMQTNVLIHIADVFDKPFIDECKQVARRELGRLQLRTKQAPNGLQVSNGSSLSAISPCVPPQRDSTDLECTVSNDAPDLLIVNTEARAEPTESAVEPNQVTTDNAAILSSDPGEDHPVQTLPDALMDGAQIESQPSNDPRMPLQDTLQLAQEGPHPEDLLVAVEGQQETPAAPQPNLLLDQAALETAVSTWIELTSDLDVEQLDALYTAMMNVIWPARHDWDRNTLLIGLTDAVRIYVARHENP